MTKPASRKYSSPSRERQASQTRSNILEATQKLLLSNGYAKTTINAIAHEANVSSQTVYAVFGSKRGIIAELLDRAVLTERLYELHERSLETSDVHEAFRLTADLVLQVHESESPIYDLLRGAGVLDPELAKIENNRECRRRDKQEEHVQFLLRGRTLRETVTPSKALDVFWCLTNRDLYRMLVQDRGWDGKDYALWLYEMLVASLLQNSHENAQGTTPSFSPQSCPRR